MSGVTSSEFDTSNIRIQIGLSRDSQDFKYCRTFPRPIAWLWASLQSQQQHTTPSSTFLCSRDLGRTLPWFFRGQGSFIIDSHRIDRYKVNAIAIYFSDFFKVLRIAVQTQFNWPINLRHLGGRNRQYVFNLSCSVVLFILCPLDTLLPDVLKSFPHVPGHYLL